MTRCYLALSLLGALLLGSGCSRPKPQVPAFLKGEKKEPEPTSPERKLQADLQSKIQQLEGKITALDKAIISTHKSQIDIAMRLKQQGVNSVEALNKPQFKENEEVQRLKTALDKNLNEVARYKQMRKDYESARFDGKNALEQLTRQLDLAQAGIGEKEMQEFHVTLRKIDARLNATEPANPVDALKGDALERALKPDK